MIQRVAYHCLKCGRFYQQLVSDPPVTVCTWCGAENRMERIDHAPTAT